MINKSPQQDRSQQPERNLQPERSPQLKKSLQPKKSLQLNNKKSEIYFLVLLSIFLLLSVEIIYLNSNNTLNTDETEQRTLYVQMVSLPDLAISSETRSIRNRSLTDLFSIFNEGPEIRDFFPASFVYSPSPNLKKQPSRITLEK